MDKQIQFISNNVTKQKSSVNLSLPAQNGRHFADDIFIRIFVDQEFCILIKISLKCVRKDSIENKPELV